MNNFNSINFLIDKRLLTKFLLSLLLLFSSMLYSQTAEDEKNFAQCKACHTIGGGKLVGPDLKGVTEKHSEQWLIKFIQNSQALIQSGDKEAIKVFEDNFKIPMPAHNLTDEQVKGILSYIKAGGKVAGGEKKTAAENTTAEAKPAAVQPRKDFSQPSIAANIVEEQRQGHRNLVITTIIMVILMLISLVDLSATHYLKAKWVHYIIILSALWVGGELIYVEAANLGRQQYYQPDQPIWFSHKVHAGQNRIDCEYCHFTAETSMHAGIPPASVCMNCHSQVKEGKQTGKKEIAKIYDAINNNKPIEWIKVHNLPDYVYFNHEQHVKVGKLDCTECHGNVEEMDQVAQVQPLSMGWCLDCHRTHEVQFTGNKFYEQYKKLHEDLKSGKTDIVTVKMIGGEDCQKCHY
jgi:cytochrome c551/c552